MGTDPTLRKICLFGNFGAGNFGNECTLQALLCNLRRYLPNAKISCICSGPEETASTYNVSAFPIRKMPLPRMNNGAMRMFRRIFIGIPIELYRWFRAIAVLKGSDMLIMTGTGMLGDFGILPLDLHYDILRWSVMAKLCRCKLLFVSVGAGPIRHPLSRRFVKAALTLANYRSYRDSFSKEYLKSIGFERKGDTVYPDLAFSLPRAIIPGNHHRDDQGAVVGVGLMTYFNKLATSENDETIYRDYLTKVAAFVNWLLDHNYTVRLLIGDAVYDKRVREDLGELLKGVTSTDRVRKIID